MSSFQCVHINIVWILGVLIYQVHGFLIRLDIEQFGRLTSLPHFVQPNVPEDREQPALDVAVIAQSTHRSDRAKIGLLHEILGIRAVPCEHKGITV